ncbi:hypothetical protein [Sphingomonas xinjiangensis]|uniref:UrcA family protein n=1 Tax=Sphingomonas xinjiangensis TaxID=643568 RepID=A0A840YNS9_9SPHN|nr:hypothetical protein [Sphingomonas xinjiangensis]MBB5711700.1 hypothetical protein [Sphingomonas xinjiangensis]
MTHAALLLLLCANCAAPAAGLDPQRLVRPLPRQVQRFITRRNGCDHFRGEEPYDADRNAEISRQLTRLCTGTDAELARLKRRHAHNPAVQRALAGYELQAE